MSQPRPAKIYLGDAVYAEVVRGDLVLTVENGISVTNRIVLEPEVLDSLLTYIKRLNSYFEEQANG